MRDDAFDSALTHLGVAQAKAQGRTPLAKQLAAQVELVVSSPLSRAVDTADAVLPSGGSGAPRVLAEGIREVAGWLLCAKRRAGSELAAKYPDWDCSAIGEEDTLWTAEIEPMPAAAARGYSVLRWIWDRCDAHQARTLPVLVLVPAPAPAFPLPPQHALIRVALSRHHCRAPHLLAAW